MQFMYSSVWTLKHLTIYILTSYPIFICRHLNLAAICNWNCSFIRLNIRFASFLILNSFTFTFSYIHFHCFELHVDCAHQDMFHTFLFLHTPYIYVLSKYFPSFTLHYIFRCYNTEKQLKILQSSQTHPIHQYKLCRIACRQKTPFTYLYTVYAENVCIFLSLSWPHFLALIFEFQHIPIFDSCKFRFFISHS